MGSSFNNLNFDIDEKWISVKSAAEFSGYNQQYLRRLLRNGHFKSKKIGQIWFIDICEFNNYLSNTEESKDKRFGPQIKHFT